MLATQNPIEHEGTYPLPEAQVDRFMLKLQVDYPTRDGGARDHRPHGRARRLPKSAPWSSRERSCARARSWSTRSTSTSKIVEYIVDLVHATRDPGPSSWPDLRASDRVRRVAARRHLPHSRPPRPRVPAGPRVRDPRRRQGDRARRAAPPASCSRTRPRPRRSTRTRCSRGSSTLESRVPDGCP